MNYLSQRITIHSTTIQGSTPMLTANGMNTGIESMISIQNDAAANVTAQITMNTNAGRTAGVMNVYRPFTTCSEKPSCVLHSPRIYPKKITNASPAIEVTPSITPFMKSVRDIFLEPT